MPLVEPPMAISTMIAFSKACSVRRSVGLTSSQTSSTARRPLSEAMRLWLESTAGMDDTPGSDIPSASAMDIIVAAVPIVMQVPGERAMPSSISNQLCSSSFPERRSSQYFQTSVPLPSVSPRQCPRSIAPPGT